MISNSQFFVLGVATSSNNLQMNKITFSLTSADWVNQIACLSGTWYASGSESVLSSDGSKVYSFFTFGPPSSSIRYLYFAGLTVNDGSVVTTRYKSSIVVLYVEGTALNGDYLVATCYSTSSYVVMYSLSSSTFTIKSFSGDDLQEWGVEPSSGR